MRFSEAASSVKGSGSMMQEVQMIQRHLGHNPPNWAPEGDLGTVLSLVPDCPVVAVAELCWTLSAVA